MYFWAPTANDSCTTVSLHATHDHAISNIESGEPSMVYPVIEWQPLTGLCSERRMLIDAADLYKPKEWYRSGSLPRQRLAEQCEDGNVNVSETML